MRFSEFLKWNIAGGAVWATGSVLAGYYAGQSWRALHHWIGRGATVAVLTIIAVLLAIRFLRR